MKLITVICDNCLNPFSGKRKIYSQKSNQKFYCSVTCSREAQQKCERPTTQDVLYLLSAGFSYTAIGKKFNVSDNAVRKWLRVEGVEPPKKEGESQTVPCTLCKKLVHKEFNQLSSKNHFCGVVCSREFQRAQGKLSFLTPKLYNTLRETMSIRGIARMYSVNHTSLINKFN